MSTFIGLIQDGDLRLPRAFQEFVRTHNGTKVEISPILPESNQQRRFYHAAVLPLITYYQEGLDHRKAADREKVHEWLKIEFNGEIVAVAGSTRKVARSTKGRLNKGYLDRLYEWMAEQGYAVHELNPESYKHWRDTVYPFGGPTNYIDYLIKLKRI